MGAYGVQKLITNEDEDAVAASAAANIRPDDAV